MGEEERPDVKIETKFIENWQQKMNFFKKGKRPVSPK